MSAKTGGHPGSVGKQVVLPWGQSVRICAAGIRTRPGRSLLTLAGVVLAVAFMAGVMTSARLADAIARTGDTNTVFALARSTGIDLGSETARLNQQRRNTWLAGLSILVATVGIANSVLMSVTERFREIGTMKCLGALDSFVVRLFFLESAFAGMIGSAVGPRWAFSWQWAASHGRWVRRRSRWERSRLMPCRSLPPRCSSVR